METSAEGRSKVPSAPEAAPRPECRDLASSSVRLQSEPWWLRCIRRDCGGSSRYRCVGMARGRSRSTQVGERTVCTTSNTNLPPEKGPNDSPECWQAYIWLSAHEAGKQASTSDFACSFTDGWCWSMTCSEFHATHRDVRGPSGRSLFFLAASSLVTEGILTEQAVRMALQPSIGRASKPRV